MFICQDKKSWEMFKTLPFSKDIASGNALPTLLFAIKTGPRTCTDSVFRDRKTELKTSPEYPPTLFCAPTSIS